MKYKIVVLTYGNHSKSSLILLANTSKFIIYFSFYDTGALSLQEMKIMGVWPISHQKELVEEGYGSFVKDLDTNITNSLSKLNIIYKTKYNAKRLSQHAINKLNCIQSLKEIIKRIIY